VVAFELSRQLVRMGHGVDVVTMHYGNLPRYEINQGINIYRTPAWRRRSNVSYTHELATYMPGALVKVLSLARQKRYDIMHCHFIVPGGPLAWTVSKSTQIPFLITCHGTDVPQHNPDRFGFAHKLISPAWRFLARNSPMLTSPSESLKRLILRNCRQANVNVIPNGIHTESFEVGQKTKSILMCSRLFAFKGFQYAIEAVKDMELDWQVDVVGEGPYLPTLKRLAEGSKTPIKFWGWLDKEDPQFRELFNRSSIFVFPSEAENFPTVLLQAMAAGTAIITSTAGGCPEVVGGAAILVQPRNVDAIRVALKKLTESEGLRDRLSKAAMARVRQFRWDRIASRYIDCYRGIMQEAAMKSVRRR